MACPVPAKADVPLLARGSGSDPQETLGSKQKAWDRVPLSGIPVPRQPGCDVVVFRLMQLPMKRREFITPLGGAVAARPLAARAQQATTVARIGCLGFGSAAASASWVEALRAGLHDLGSVGGKNIVIEFRWAERVDQLPELAAELVRMNVEAMQIENPWLINGENDHGLCNLKRRRNLRKPSCDAQISLR